MNVLVSWIIILLIGLFIWSIFTVVSGIIIKWKDKSDKEEINQLKEELKELKKKDDWGDY